MNKEINAYAEYLLNFGVVKKPPMPNFDVSAYTDNEYLFSISDLNIIYDEIDDEYLTIQHLMKL